MIQGEPDVASLRIPGSATRKARALHEVKVQGEMCGQFSTWQMRYGCAQGSFLLVNMARLGSIRQDRQMRKRLFIHRGVDA